MEDVSINSNICVHHVARRSHPETLIEDIPPLISISVLNLRDRLDHAITLDGIHLASKLTVMSLWVTFDWDLSFNLHMKMVSRWMGYGMMDCCNSSLSGRPNQSLRIIHQKCHRENSKKPLWKIYWQNVSGAIVTRWCSDGGWRGWRGVSGRGGECKSTFLLCVLTLFGWIWLTVVC